MVPPPGETCRVVVERERRVAGEVLLRNGHMERDCLRRDSIALRICQICFCFGSVVHSTEEKAIEKSKNDVVELGRGKTNVPRDLLRGGSSPFPLTTALVWLMDSRGLLSNQLSQ